MERLTRELRVLRRESEKGFDALADIDEAWDAFGTAGNRKALTLAEQITSQGRELDDALDKLAAAERALASKDGVQVKALEWDNLGYAHVPFEGRYYVGVYRPGQWEMRSPGMEDSTFPDGLFGSEDAAKAAAQADYDRRIRSALTTPPPAQDAPVGDGGEVYYVSAEQLQALPSDPPDAGGAAYLPVRRSPKGKFQQALYATPTPPAGDALREAAERVVWFDWSDNDSDAVAAISALRATLHPATTGGGDGR